MTDKGSEKCGRVVQQQSSELFPVHVCTVCGEENIHQIWAVSGGFEVLCGSCKEWAQSQGLVVEATSLRLTGEGVKRCLETPSVADPQDRDPALTQS